MKILHIIDSLGLGGAQIVVKGIFEIQKENKNIFLFALRQNSPEFKIQHPNVFIYPSLKRFSFEPIKEIINFIKKEKIQFLHCHLFRSQVFGWILKTLFFPKIKLIFHEHGQILGSDSFNKKEDFIFETFLRFAKKQVDLFVAVSETIQKKLIKKVSANPQKINILYNFVDEMRFNKKNYPLNTENIRKELNILPNEYIIGFIGRLIVGKGWRELLEALEHFPAEYPIKLLIAGDGVDREIMLERVKGKNLEKKIIYLGYVANSETQFYPLIDVLVVPSYKEAMGLVELEAFAMEIPVIASNIEGLNEIVNHGQNGLLCEVKNSKDLAEKIRLLYENKDLAEKLSKQAKIDVEAYTLSNYVDKLSSIYR